MEKAYRTRAKARHRSPHRFPKIGRYRPGTHRKGGQGIPSLSKSKFVSKGRGGNSYQEAMQNELS